MAHECTSVDGVEGCTCDPEDCDECGGERNESCWNCGGDGIECRPGDDDGDEEEETCCECNGTGLTVCDVCSGTGEKPSA